MKTAIDIARANALSISKAGLAFTFGFAASAIMLASVNAYIERTKAPATTLCAIEVRMNDGNVYRPSVADTCKEAWQGFDWNRLPADWREAMANPVKR